MKLEDGFIPDFTFAASNGQICNKSSHFRQIKGHTWISLNNKLNMWNTATMELEKSYGSVYAAISSFLVLEDTVIIGYENGGIEIIKIYTNENITSNKIKIHARRVVAIEHAHDGFISASSDGSLIYYDLVLSAIKHTFEASNASITRISCSDRHVIAACLDNSLRIWDISREALQDAIVLDSPIAGIVMHGGEALVGLKSGTIFILNIQTRDRIEFTRYKNIRNILKRDDKVVVQLPKKTYIYSITKESTFGLVLSRQLPSSNNYTRIDLCGEKLIFLSKLNKIEIEDQKMNFISHSGDIKSIAIVDDTVFSLSSEKLLVWKVFSENKFSDAARQDQTASHNNEAEFKISEYNSHSIEPVAQIEFVNATGFVVFQNYIVVAEENKVILLNMNFYEKIKEIKITEEYDKIIHLSAFANTLAVSLSNVVQFRDSEFNLVETLTTHDLIVYTRFSPDGSLFAVSCLDNKAYVYEYPSLNQKFSLYGHSLPVRHISFSHDSKMLASCGTDKLIKLWGLDFGECRKSFIGNAKNLEYLNESLFMYCDGEIVYYNGLSKLRRFRMFSPELIEFGNEFLVVSSGTSLALYTMDEYEFLEALSDSEEDYELLNKNVASITDYERFLDFLEKCEASASGDEDERFYCFLEGVDFTELSKYLEILDSLAVSLILKLVLKNVDRNTVLNARIILELFKSNMDLCLQEESFQQARSHLLANVSVLKDTIGVNGAKMTIGMNYKNIDLDVHEE
ncbi:hypothetical protein ENBRE01_0151 [Enteropsectra breve]|nr:hypothetical protein ENBRE01_0151 [Enteropsectra breve]